MPTGLLLFITLFGHAFGKHPPDVDCWVVHLEYVSCMWNQDGLPDFNYTFSSWFYKKDNTECTRYLSENNVNIGCHQPYKESDRFSTFTTELAHGGHVFPQTHELKEKVRLNPPTNLTVLNGSDHNLWFYWNQTRYDCVESQVRHRTDNKNWMNDSLSNMIQSYCINLPSNNHRYELQVRSRMEEMCGGPSVWSNWSEPVVWGANNSTVLSQMFVWTPVVYAVGAITLIGLVITLVYHERLRVISVVPKPFPIPRDIEDWFQFPKGLKENLKANYNELACPVREYNHVCQSDSSDGSDGSNGSATTDQTDCSVSSPVNEPEDDTECCSSSASTVPCEEEKPQELT